MPNVKHASKSVEAYTPPELLELARGISGRFALDPASCAAANRFVQAAVYWTKRNANPLRRPWDARGPVWLNPPGGVIDPVTLRPPGPKKPGKRAKRPVSSAAAWWAKMRAEFERGAFEQGWFLSFTLELLATGQGQKTAELVTGEHHPGGVLEFPTLILEKRLRFVDRYGRPIQYVDAKGKRHTAPTHHNALTWVTRERHAAQRFAEAAEGWGTVVQRVEPLRLFVGGKPTPPAKARKLARRKRGLDAAR